MSCSLVDNFPHELFVLHENFITVYDGTTCSSKTMENVFSDNMEYDDSYLDDSCEEKYEEFIPSKVSFNPFDEYMLIPSREELFHFKNDLWFTKGELNEMRELHCKKLDAQTKSLFAKINGTGSSKIPIAMIQSKWRLLPSLTMFPKSSVRSKLCDDVINLPPIS